MGILNLHKFLEKCSSRNHLSALRGSVVGVDAMCWLHRGAVASAWELLTGEDTDKFLRFFVKMLSLCNACGVRVVVVFDGASLPAKAEEEQTRRTRRRENSEKAKLEISEKKISNFGQVDPKLKSMIVQSVSISPEMITRCMSVLRRLGVEFIVAPFEADAQLAYMYAQGDVSGVISEDSDLLAFGCHRLISKLDTTGDFADLRIDWAFRGPDKAFGKPVDLGQIGKLEKWDQAKFVDLCILAGSDYKLGKVDGIGIKKAFALLCKLGSMDRVISHMAEAKKWTLATLNQYRSDLAYSRTAFSHHRVFDSKTNACVFLNGFKETPELINVVGPAIAPDQCRAIMLGEIDAKTLVPREFLHKLPPGLLGRYNASKADSKPPEEAVAPDAAPSDYSSLEAQIVAEFARQKKPPISDESYLSSLSKLVLKRDEKNEWDDLDALLQLDEEMQFQDESDQLTSFANESFIEDSDMTREATDIVCDSGATCETGKTRNPFAGRRSVGKKARSDEFTLPTQTSCSSSPVNPIMELFRKKITPTAFVTHRDIVPKEHNSFFTRRSG